MNAERESLPPDTTALLRRILNVVETVKPTHGFEVACAAGGVRVLRAWLGAGAKLQAATPFLEMILKDSSP